MKSIDTLLRGLIFTYEHKSFFIKPVKARYDYVSRKRKSLFNFCFQINDRKELFLMIIPNKSCYLGSIVVYDGHSPLQVLFNEFCLTLKIDNTKRAKALKSPSWLQLLFSNGRSFISYFN